MSLHAGILAALAAGFLLGIAIGQVATVRWVRRLMDDLLLPCGTPRARESQLEDRDRGIAIWPGEGGR